MRSSFRFAVVAFGLLASGLAFAADDRLGVPGPIEISGTRYQLAFADEPQPGYVKQEYLPEGQTLDRFETMVLVEFMEGATVPADVVRPQVQMLEERRAIDPLVNYEIFLAEEGDGICYPARRKQARGSRSGTPIAMSPERTRTGRRAAGSSGSVVGAMARRSRRSSAAFATAELAMSQRWSRWACRRHQWTDASADRIGHPPGRHDGTR